MRIAGQLLVYAMTFLMTFLGGVLFSLEITHIIFKWRGIYGGKPLPLMTDFFINNRQLPFYLLVIPWLIYIGAPLLRRVPSYFDSESFVFRTVVFFAAEFFVLSVCLQALLMPFVTVTCDMHFDTTWLEYAAQGLFWTLIVSILALAMWRLWQKFRRR